MEIITELLKDDCIKTMKERGYTQTAHSGNEKTWYFVKKMDSKISIRAEVYLATMSVTLSMIELDLCCSIQQKQFDFFTKDFTRFENKIWLYSIACLEADKRADFSVHLIDTEEKPKSLYDKIDDRKKSLWNSIRQVGKEKGYQKEMCLEFYAYWTEKNPAGKKMRFEMEKVFDIGRRLNTWLLHDKKWSKTFVDNKVEKQEEKLKEKTTIINKKEVF